MFVDQLAAGRVRRGVEVASHSWEPDDVDAHVSGIQPLELAVKSLSSPWFPAASRDRQDPLSKTRPRARQQAFGAVENPWLTGSEVNRPSSGSRPVPRPVSPSSPPSPMVELHRRDASPRYFQVRAAEILLPAWGSANNSSRIRNNGKAVEVAGLAEARLSLGMSASAPGLLGNASEPTSPGISPGGPRRPKLPQGTLRSISQVDIQYPEWNPLTLEGRLPPRLNFNELVSRPKRKMVVKPRAMRWTDLPAPKVDAIKNITTGESPDPLLPTVGLERGRKLLQGLHDLRRTNKKEPQEQIEDKPIEASVPQDANKETSEGPEGVWYPPVNGGEVEADKSLAPISSRSLSPKPDRYRRAGSPPPPPAPGKNGEFGADEADSLLPATLKELGDTVAMLQNKIDSVSWGTEAVRLCGGGRHATNIISIRTLQVMERKKELLKGVEDRRNALEAAHARRDQLLKEICQGRNVPDVFLGIHPFIKTFEHRPGEPVDAPRSDFKAFAISFKLPVKHNALTGMANRGMEIGDWWATAAATEAAKGASKEAIENLMLLSRGVGADPEHPMLYRAQAILLERIAEKVLKDAKALEKKDEAVAARTSDMSKLVGSGEKMAAEIDEAIEEAVKAGVKRDEARIEEAAGISKKLRELDGERKRMAYRQKQQGALKKAISGKMLTGALKGGLGKS